MAILRSLLPLSEGAVHGPAMRTATALWLSAGFALAILARNTQEWIDVSMAGAIRRMNRTGIRSAILGATIGAEIVLIIMLALISASRSVTEFIYFNF